MEVKSSQVKSSQVKYNVGISYSSVSGYLRDSGATRPRGDHPDPNVFLPPALRGLWRGIIYYDISDFRPPLLDYAQERWEPHLISLTTFYDNKKWFFN